MLSLLTSHNSEYHLATYIYVSGRPWVDCGSLLVSSFALHKWKVHFFYCVCSHLSMCFPVLGHKLKELPCSEMQASCGRKSTSIRMLYATTLMPATWIELCTAYSHFIGQACYMTKLLFNLRTFNLPSIFSQE